MAPGGTEEGYWLAMCIEVSSCLDLEQPLFFRQHFDDEVYSSRLCMENKPVMDQLFTQQCTFKLLLNCWFFPDWVLPEQCPLCIVGHTSAGWQYQPESGYVLSLLYITGSNIFLDTWLHLQARMPAGGYTIGNADLPCQNKVQEIHIHTCQSTTSNILSKG